MNKKRLIIFLGALILLVAIYFPSLSKLQQLKEENTSLENQINELKKNNTALQERINRLQTDPAFVEQVAREKLKKAKEGEIIYRTE